MFFRLLNTVSRKRRAIAWVTLVFFFAGLVYVLVRGRQYESQALLFPPFEEGGQGILSAWMAKLNIPSVIAPVGAGATSAAILGDILESRRVREMVIDTLSLRDHFKTKTIDDAIRELRGRTKITITETGLIHLAVRDRDPEYALRINRAYIAALDSLNRFLQYTRADETRTFIAGQIQHYRVQLKNVRDNMAAFQREHNIVNFTEQVRGAIDVAADLKVRTVLAGIELDLINEYTHRDASELRRKTAEYESLSRQLRNIMEGDSAGAVFVPLLRLPKLTQRYAEMQRDLEVGERVYSYLLERYEEAGIEKARTTPVVQIVDEPELPEKPAGMSLVLIVLFVTAAGFVWAAAVVCWWEWAVTRPKSPDEERALEELRSAFHSDLGWLRRRLKL